MVSRRLSLAPEAKFPAAYDDAVAAYKWVAANAATFNGDPKRAGGGRRKRGRQPGVATVALAARDQKLHAPRHAACAVYPVRAT